MKRFNVSYRSLLRDEKNNDDPLRSISVECHSASAAPAAARKERTDIHYVVSVTEA